MIVYTTQNQFRNNMQKIIDAILQYNKPKKIFLVNIAHPSKSLKEKNYNVQNQIIQYNNILSRFQNELISIIDIYSFTKNNSDSLLGDEHISTKGHDFIADTIRGSLEKLH